MAVFAVPHRAARHVTAVLVAMTLLATPQAQATGSARLTEAASSPVGQPAAAAAPFRMNLADAEDYVRQSNFVQCVGASIQMMLNITRPGSDRTARTQRRLQVLARSLSGPRPDGTERQGAGVFGWADALNRAGEGSYAVVGARTLQGAMRIAASAIRDQRRPVGLLVWRGRHAWVMSGFKATGDPRDGSFRVTEAYILDPLHPFGSKTWGPSPRPGSAIGVEQVGRQFVRRRAHSEWNQLPGMAELAGKYVLVVPVDGPPPPNPAIAVPARSNAAGEQPQGSSTPPSRLAGTPAGGWLHIVCATLRYSGRWGRRRLRTRSAARIGAAA
jgi:hypothetical protein